MARRLSTSTSPYLQQHADNPVDWWEWGPEAFAEARRRDVPILLSVGYAACHWCHVMAHESFEDETTAVVLNDLMVSIKVDREERPDVDAVYMAAVQAMTGRGGWPMTVFLTPEGEPFFAGTYFPPEPRHGSASFLQVVEAVSTAWRERRDEVTQAARSAVERLTALARFEGEGPAPSEDDLSRAVQVLAGSFDPRHAGFGGAPKFPPSMTLLHLLRHHVRTGDDDAWFLARRTLEAMARGGMYDQLSGGFARYSVDAAWVVPHFEKMLYDNALLLRAYAQAWRIWGDPLHARIAAETADFLLAELLTAEGGFASSLDADSEGVEGRFAVWRPAELDEVLGPDDGRWAAQVLSVTADGTFEDGASVLQLLADPDDAGRWADVRARLRAARERRVRPARDDKVVAAWNGLAITALAEAGRILDRPDLLAAAERAADLLLAVHLVEDEDEDEGAVRLRRVSRDGAVGTPWGVLEDYGCVAEGFLTLFMATGESSWFDLGAGLVDRALGDFQDDDGHPADTARDAERLITRPADPADNASPSGRSALAMALVVLAGLTGDPERRTQAERMLGVAGSLARQSPRFAGWALAAAEALADGPVQVAVIGPDAASREPLLAAAWAAPTAGAVIAAGPPGATVPALLSGRTLVDGQAAAYPCRGFVCALPTTDPSSLRRALDPSRGSDEEAPGG
jgi:uncharacterized protein YyaL (SSP411 family)